MNCIRNIYCVGRNYLLHAEELNNKIPTSPLIFTKPTHAAVEANGKEIILPGDRGTIHYEMELVIRITKPYSKGIMVNEIVDAMAIGIDFTLRDVQTELKEKGYPWLLAKGFKNSAVLTPFIKFPGTEECKKLNFSLLKNGQEVQVGNIKDMIFDLQTIVEYSAHHFGLGKGDIIFTGTPKGVGPVYNNDLMALMLGEKVLGQCKIKLDSNPLAN